MAQIPTVSQRILDLSIRHKVGLASYESWVVGRVIGLLDRADADLERRISIALEKSSPRDTLERLAAIRRELMAVNAEAYRQAGAFLTDEMRSLVVDSSEALADMVEGVLPFKFSATRPAATLLHSLVTQDPLHGRLIGPHIENIAGNRAAALMEQIQQGVVQGESWGPILQRIRGTAAGGYRDGVLETIGRRQAEALARTAVQHFSEAGRDRLIQENADLFKAIMWVSTLDRRTTPICQVRDGLVWTLDYRPVGHDLAWLGGPGRAHWQCRSTSIPVLRDFEDLAKAGIAPENLGPGERAALEGPVPVTTNFEDWLRNQDRELQDSVLGVNRAARFRSGVALSDVWDMRFDRIPGTARYSPRQAASSRLGRVDVSAQQSALEDALASGQGTLAQLQELSALDEAAALSAVRRGAEALAPSVRERAAGLTVGEIEAWLATAADNPALHEAVSAELAIKVAARDRLADELAALKALAPKARIDDLARLDPQRAEAIRAAAFDAAVAESEDLLTFSVPSLESMLASPGIQGTFFADALEVALSSRRDSARAIYTRLAANPFGARSASLAQLEAIDPEFAAFANNELETILAKALQPVGKLTLPEVEAKVGEASVGTVWRERLQAVLDEKQSLLKDLLLVIEADPKFSDLDDLVALHPELGKKVKKKTYDKTWVKAEAVIKQVKSGKKNLAQAHAELALLDPTESLYASLLKKKLAQYEDVLKAGGPVVEAPFVQKTTVPGTGTAGPEPVDILDGSTWRQVGPQAGSNPGGLYEGSQGTFYVKFPKPGQDIDRLREEILASRLYQASGIKVPELHFVDLPGGQRGVASKIIEGAGKSTAEKLRQHADVRDGFVVDAWLANWDVAGATLDNILVSKAGAYRIDLGGSLRYRAQGSFKGTAWGDVVGELESLRNAGINPNTAKIFGGFTPKEITEQIARLEATMTDDAIRRTVLSVPGLRDPNEVIKTLIARRNYLSGVKKGILDELADGLDWYKATGPDDIKNYWTGNAGKGSRTWVAGLSDPEKTAVQRYSDGHYHELNRNLRQAGGTGYLPTDAQHLESALRRSSLPRNTTVFRGCSADFLGNAGVGSEVVDWGFVSTSMNPGGAFSGALRLEIRIPAGRAGAAYIKPLSYHKQEFEVLLQRGSRFRVLSIDRSKSPPKIVLEWLGGVS